MEEQNADFYELVEQVRVELHGDADVTAMSAPVSRCVRFWKRQRASPALMEFPAN